MLHPDFPRAVLLPRELGLIDATAVGLGAVIGAGIFVVIGVAAGVAGPALIVGLLLAGCAALCNALSSAALAARFPEAGGTYVYGTLMLHPFAGFSAGWLFLVSKLAAGGTVALGVGTALAELFPALPARWGAVLATGALVVANWYGVRKAGRLNALIVAVTLASLCAFVIAGAPHFDRAHWSPFATRGTAGVFESAALLFFAYTGYARIATLGSEVRSPATTIPRAIILTVGVSTALYVAVAVVTIGLVGAPELASSAAPLQHAALRIGEPWIVWSLGVGAVTAMLGVLLSQILGISRMAYAMGRQGDLPCALAAVHPTHRVPHRAVIGTGLVVGMVAIGGGLRDVVSIAAFAILLYYAITNLAALGLGSEGGRALRWISSIGMVSCVVLAASLELRTIAWGLLTWVIGAIAYVIARRRQRFEVGPADLADRQEALAIHAVQMAAYAQEASLLGARDFPPLLRTVEELVREPARFTVARIGREVVAAIGVDVDHARATANIDSLVVHPDRQRRGIARRLLEHVIDEHAERTITVQTGARNAPALALYNEYGFVEIARWHAGADELEIVRLRRDPSARS